MASPMMAVACLPIPYVSCCNFAQKRFAFLWLRTMQKKICLFLRHPDTGGITNFESVSAIDKSTRVPVASLSLMKARWGLKGTAFWIVWLGKRPTPRRHVESRASSVPHGLTVMWGEEEFA